LEKVKKVTSDIVSVFVSVKIRRWTFLRQEGFQHFEQVFSINIILIIIIAAAAAILSQFLLRVFFPFPPVLVC
jgi:hypothetical protein